MRVAAPSLSALQPLLRDATIRFSEDPTPTPASGSFTLNDRLHSLALGSEGSRYTVTVEQDGLYALFTEHRGGDEYHLRIDARGVKVPPLLTHVFKPDHVHDRSVSSVGIVEPRAVDAEKFSAWLNRLVRERGVDIFRMKGILNVAGHDERWVFHGVHMLLSGQPGRSWDNELRKSSLIFIGRNLIREELTQGFEACLA
ncbi:MAG TPA: GTP-binding protein, partial [Verrucomicrobiae bacterium]|nr:GTP-binding protein [Verrucomicrobiae bacterium]